MQYITYCNHAILVLSVTFSSLDFRLLVELYANKLTDKPKLSRIFPAAKPDFFG